MENKLTAVEWLLCELQTKMPLTTQKMYNENQLLFEDIFLKAKEMEKEQHECTCVNVIERILDSMDKGEKINSKDIFEQYYNETFNK